MLIPLVIGMVLYLIIGIAIYLDLFDKYVHYDTPKSKYPSKLIIIIWWWEIMRIILKG